VSWIIPCFQRLSLCLHSKGFLTKFLIFLLLLCILYSHPISISMITTLTISR
jgi:hypothetical protein